MRLTMDKKFEVLKCIEEHGEKADNEGKLLFNYHHGWNDTRVGKACGVEPKVAARYRHIVFGKLKTRATDGQAIEDLSQRVSVLEVRLNTVLQELRATEAANMPHRVRGSFNGVDAEAS